MGRREQMQRRLEELTKSSDVLDHQRQTLLTMRRQLLAQRPEEDDEGSHLPASLLPPTSSIHITEDDENDTVDGDAELQSLGISPCSAHTASEALGVGVVSSSSLNVAASHSRGSLKGDPLTRYQSEAEKPPFSLWQSSLDCSAAPRGSPPPQPHTSSSAEATRRSKSLHSRPTHDGSENEAELKAKQRSKRCLSDPLAEAAPGPRSGRTSPRPSNHKVGFAVPADIKSRAIDMETWRAQTAAQKQSLKSTASVAVPDARRASSASVVHSLLEGDSSIIAFAVGVETAMTEPCPLHINVSAMGAVEVSETRQQRLASQRRIVQQLEQQLKQLSCSGLYAPSNEKDNGAVTELGATFHSPPAPRPAASRSKTQSTGPATTAPKTDLSRLPPPPDAAEAPRPGQTYQRLLEHRAARSASSECGVRTAGT